MAKEKLYPEEWGSELSDFPNRLDENDVPKDFKNFILKIVNDFDDIICYDSYEYRRYEENIKNINSEPVTVITILFDEFENWDSNNEPPANRYEKVFRQVCKKNGLKGFFRVSDNGTMSRQLYNYSYLIAYKKAKDKHGNRCNYLVFYWPDIEDDRNYAEYIQIYATKDNPKLESANIISSYSTFNNIQLV